MTDTREPLTSALVWLFVSEGCNAREIAAFGHITEAAALAWMGHACREFSRRAA